MKRSLLTLTGFLVTVQSPANATLVTTITGTIMRVSGTDLSNLEGADFMFQGTISDSTWELFVGGGGGPKVDVTSHTISISGSAGANDGVYSSAEGIVWHGFVAGTGKLLADDQSGNIDFVLNDSAAAIFSAIVGGGIPGGIGNPVIMADWGIGPPTVYLNAGPTSYVLQSTTFNVTSVPETSAIAYLFAIANLLVLIRLGRHVLNRLNVASTI
jgi:hypothetical protein